MSMLNLKYLTILIFLAQMINQLVGLMLQKSLMLVINQIMMVQVILLFGFMVIVLVTVIKEITLLLGQLLLIEDLKRI